MQNFIWLILILIFISEIELGSSIDVPAFCDEQLLESNKNLMMTALNANNTYYVFRNESILNVTTNSTKEVVFKWDSMLQPSVAGEERFHWDSMNFNLIFLGYPFKSLKTFKSGFTITKVKCKKENQCDDKRMEGLTFIFTQRRTDQNAYCIYKMIGQKFVIANYGEIPWNLRQCNTMAGLRLDRVNTFSGVVFVEEQQLIVGISNGFIYSALLPKFEGNLFWGKYEFKSKYKDVNGAFYEGTNAYFIIENDLYRVVIDKFRGITLKNVKQLR